MLRSTEALIAAIVIFYSLVSLFKVPDVTQQDPIQLYINTLLKTYQDEIENLATKDPAVLGDLLLSAMPVGYNALVAINIYRPLYIFTGTSRSLPYETYLLIPGSATANLNHYSLINNWYRAVFTVTNTGNSTISTEESLTVKLAKVDLNSDGSVEPIDPSCLFVFSDDGPLNYKLTNYTDYLDSAVVGLRVNITIQPDEKKHIYVYYMIGDDCE